VPGSNPLQDNVRTCLPTQEISEQLCIIYPTLQSDWFCIFRHILSTHTHTHTHTHNMYGNWRSCTFVFW